MHRIDNYVLGSWRFGQPVQGIVRLGRGMEVRLAAAIDMSFYTHDRDNQMGQAGEALRQSSDANAAAVFVLVLKDIVQMTKAGIDRTTASGKPPHRQARQTMGRCRA